MKDRVETALEAVNQAQSLVDREEAAEKVFGDWGVFNFLKWIPFFPIGLYEWLMDVTDGSKHEAAGVELARLKKDLLRLRQEFAIKQKTQRAQADAAAGIDRSGKASPAPPARAGTSVRRSVSAGVGASGQPHNSRLAGSSGQVSGEVP